MVLQAHSWLHAYKLYLWSIRLNLSCKVISSPARQLFLVFLVVYIASIIFYPNYSILNKIVRLSLHIGQSTPIWYAITIRRVSFLWIIMMYNLNTYFGGNASVTLFKLKLSISTLISSFFHFKSLSQYLRVFTFTLSPLPCYHNILLYYFRLLRQLIPIS